MNDVETGLADVVAAEIRALDGRAVSHHGSVADAELAAGLVNNAGVNHRADPWSDDPARMREVVEVNVLGPLFRGTAAAKVLRVRGGGVIVNIGSGSMIGQRRAAAYSASKGAVASRVAPLVTYLLSDLSAGVTGQILRFRGDILCVLGQTAIKGGAGAASLGQVEVRPGLRRPAADLGTTGAVVEDLSSTGTRMAATTLSNTGIYVLQNRMRSGYAKPGPPPSGRLPGPLRRFTDQRWSRPTATLLEDPCGSIHRVGVSPDSGRPTG